MAGILAVRFARNVSIGDYIIVDDDKQARVKGKDVRPNLKCWLETTEGLHEFEPDEQVVIVGRPNFTTNEDKLASRIVFKTQYGKPGDKAGIAFGGREEWVITNEFKYLGDRYVVAEAIA